MKFNISKISRVESNREKNKPWKMLLLSIILATSLFKTSSAQSINFVQNDNIKQEIYAGYPTQSLNVTGFNLAKKAMMKNIKQSTVVLVITDENWIPFGLGSGSILADHKSNGEKNILTILHVVGTENLNKGKIHIVAIDYNDSVLGVVKPIINNIPEATCSVNSDQPILLEFDNNYFINKDKLNEINGLRLDNNLPRGMMRGVINSGVGASPGASGGPWFNNKGKIIGVSDSVSNIVVFDNNKDVFNINNYYKNNITNSNKIFEKEVLVFGKSLLRVLSKPSKKEETILVPTEDKILVQGVGAPSLIKELKKTEVKPMMYKITENFEYKNSFGLGYPMGIPMAYEADLKLGGQYNNKILEKYIKSVDVKRMESILSYDRSFIVDPAKIKEEQKKGVYTEEQGKKIIDADVSAQSFLVSKLKIKKIKKEIYKIGG